MPAGPPICGRWTESLVVRVRDEAASSPGLVSTTDSSWIWSHSLVTPTTRPRRRPIELALRHLVRSRLNCSPGGERVGAHSSTPSKSTLECWSTIVMRSSVTPVPPRTRPTRARVSVAVGLATPRRVTMTLARRASWRRLMRVLVGAPETVTFAWETKLSFSRDSSTSSHMRFWVRWWRSDWPRKTALSLRGRWRCPWRRRGTRRRRASRRWPRGAGRTRPG